MMPDAPIPDALTRDAPAPDAPVPDAPVPDAEPPVPCDASSCSIDCFGGSECVDGKAWVNYFAPLPCCAAFSLTVCARESHTCASGTCGTVDPRYAICTQMLGTPNEPCVGADCEYLRLLCPEGAAKHVGSPCAADADCRPAATGVLRLHCDDTSHLCVELARPDPLPGYRASCGLTFADLSNLDGEFLSPIPTPCNLCQVYVHDGCLRQACTMPCTFDEDCPAGAVCLCSSFISSSEGYCAAGVTDRTTSEGRAAGLPACPGP